MQNQENKLNNIEEQNDSQVKKNINNPSIRTNNVINSSKDIRNPIFKDQSNLPNLENYIKRNSPMQSIKTMFNLNLPKDENNQILNQNNSFYQDFSPKIDNNFIPLTPQIVPNDQKHLNKKYFPSKANVCKGNPDSNPKFIIPSSSPIVQYFASGNVDNILNGDLGFSLENGNSNIFGERISHLSNISQSEMFNFSPSEFFNRNSYGMGSDKNIDGFLMNEAEGGGEDEKNTQKEEEDELCAVELEMGNLDINVKDDDNIILNKINEMKTKKQKEKGNLSNAKGHRNSNNNKNNNHRKIKKKESQNHAEVNKNNENIKKTKNNQKEQNINSNNNKSINEKNINQNKNNIGKENSSSNNNDSTSPKVKSNDNQSSNEENNHGDYNQNISLEFTKKLEDYFDTHFNDNSIPKKEKNNEDNDPKKEDALNKNMNNENNTQITNANNTQITNANNMESDNKKNNYNLNSMPINNNNLNINSINSMPNKSVNNNVDKNNLNYINGMNIRCTNLNINNFTNLNNNSQTGNYYEHPNHQQILKYLQSQNNSNYLMLNQNPNFMNNNDIYNLNNNIPNLNNFNNNIYNNLNGMNLYNMNLLNNQMNSINKMNMNPFYIQNNNIMQGYPFFSNNNSQNNNFNIDLKKNKKNNNYMNNSNLINNNRIIMNNNMNNNMNSNMNNNMINKNTNTNNLNQLNNDQKKKKIKRLEVSAYMDKPLSYIAENFGMMGKDQGACRYIQKLLNDNPTESLNALYVPICKNVLQLINDPFGNYLIQKIITLLNDEQLYEILKIISPFFFEICCNTHGTRVLQKLVEHSNAPKVKGYFFELLKPLITPLLKQLNGTFVVQKFAEVNSKEYGQEINEIIVENSPVLSTHRHGCCVIQKYLELKDPIMTPNLLNKLIDNCLLLIIDQFGNYVIQTILLMGDKNYGNRLAEKIVENVVYYAKHKYSSNVVEKCFDYCDGIYLQNLMNNVQKKDNLRELILDEHGNYVVQKVLALSKPNVQRAMLKIIVPLFEKLKNFPYGERVINRLLISYPIINDKNFLSSESDI